MSEFKYACPVCGQHISCDSSQAGTQMECPTCFQKITVPQALTTEGDQKFILTGTQKSDRPVPVLPENSPIVQRKSSVAVILILLLLVAVAAGIGVYAFRVKIFKAKPSPSENQVTKNQSTSKPPVKPPAVAPHANDRNWMLNLSAAEIPDATAAGRIHGEDFIVQRAILENGTLTLREGRSGKVNLGLQINFGNVEPESLARQSLNIVTNTPMAAHVTMIWSEGSTTVKSNLDGGYAMHLDFGPMEWNRYIPVKIYFCAPDNLKSYVMGNFNAQIQKSKPPRKR